MNGASPSPGRRSHAQELIRQAFALANSWRWDDGGGLLAVRTALLAGQEALTTGSARTSPAILLRLELRWSLAAALMRSRQLGSCTPAARQIEALGVLVERVLDGAEPLPQQVLPPGHPSLAHGQPTAAVDGLAYLTAWTRLATAGAVVPRSSWLDALVFAELLETALTEHTAAALPTGERDLLRTLRRGALQGSPTILLMPRSERQERLRAIQRQGLALRSPATIPGAPTAMYPDPPADLAGLHLLYRTAYRRSWDSGISYKLPSVASLVRIQRRIARGEPALHPALAHHLAALRAVQRERPELGEPQLCQVLERAGQCAIPGSLHYPDEQVVGYALDRLYARRS